MIAVYIHLLHKCKYVSIVFLSKSVVILPQCVFLCIFIILSYFMFSQPIVPFIMVACSV